MCRHRLTVLVTYWMWSWRALTVLSRRSTLNHLYCLTIRSLRWLSTCSSVTARSSTLFVGVIGVSSATLTYVMISTNRRYFTTHLLMQPAYSRVIMRHYWRWWTSTLRLLTPGYMLTRMLHGMMVGVEQWKWKPASSWQVWKQLSGLASAVNIHASLLSAALHRLLALVDKWQYDYEWS